MSAAPPIQPPRSWTSHSPRTTRARRSPGGTAKRSPTRRARSAARSLVTVGQAGAVLSVAVDVQENRVCQRERIRGERLAVADDRREGLVAVDAHDDIAVGR